MMEEQENGKAAEGVELSDFSSLPEGVVAKILSLTTPLDVCRLSAVSKIFHAAVQSDIVWNEFLPNDWKLLISRQNLSKLKFDPILSPKKEIFFSLCYYPVLIDDGNKSFSLEKWGGKKCIMLGARELRVVWTDTSNYYNWQCHPYSRFTDGAMLFHVWWHEISARINCTMLSHRTTYAVYFVFNMSTLHYVGFHIDPVDVTVGILGSKNHQRSVCLDPNWDNPRGLHNPRRLHRHAHPQYKSMVGLERPRRRHDGWFEIEMGEFDSGDGDDEVEMTLMEVKVKGENNKSGIIVQGIEIRPKRSTRHVVLITLELQP